MKKNNDKRKLEEKKCNCGEQCTCENCNCGEECCCTENGCTCGENCTCENCNCDKKCCCDNDGQADSSEPLKEEIQALKSTINGLNEKIKISQAELINYRKRKDEETSNIIKYANQDLIVELLPILDNFERALNMKLDTPEFQKYSDGYKILYSHLVDTLKKFGVEEIPAIGLEFNPNLHEAVMVGCDEDKKEDEILEVFSKGYTLKGRVIRASKVRVNKL